MENKENKKTDRGLRLIKIVQVISFLLLIFVPTGIQIFSVDKDYSAQEKRELAKKPKLTTTSLLEGGFQDNYETYLSDQFPARNTWITVKTEAEYLLGKREMNGVYFGKDNYLMEKYDTSDFSWKRVKKNLQKTSEFIEANENTKVMFVPTKSRVMADKLPPFSEGDAEDRFYELASEYIPEEHYIQTESILKEHTDEYIYYRTDHHWTMLGAYYAYVAWAEQMGFEPLSLEAFEVKEGCDDFYGTTYAKVNTRGKADTISLYETKEDFGYTLDYNMGEFQSDSFYDESKLDSDDKYEVFFGGNQPLVEITGNTGSDKTLLIIKDSFGNCFAPFAANHYKKTIVVDMRYVNIAPSRLAQAYQADDILILYNSAQYMNDRNVGKLG